MYIKLFVTNNNFMNEALIYLGAAGLLIFIFPFYVNNYIYINTAEKYASLNVGIFKFNFYNANTVKNKPGEMQINGKNKKMDIKKFKLSFYKIFNTLCLYKIIQLGDYGMGSEGNAYVALAQHGLTTAIYKFVQMNGNYCKLRNYTIFNEEHSEIHYYLKAVTILNLAVVAKIMFILIMEKLNELKN